MAFDSQEEATLHCTMVGGYQAVHNISLVKNGQVIRKGSSREITYTTSGGLPRSVYGLYGCTVSNTVGSVSDTVLLQHEGDLQIPSHITGAIVSLCYVTDTSRKINCECPSEHLMIVNCFLPL